MRHFSLAVKKKVFHFLFVIKLLVINQNIPNAFSSKVKKTTSDCFLRKGVGDKVPLLRGCCWPLLPVLVHRGGGTGSKASEGGDRVVGKKFQNLMYELTFLRGH